MLRFAILDVWWSFFCFDRSLSLNMKKCYKVLCFCWLIFAIFILNHGYLAKSLTAIYSNQGYFLMIYPCRWQPFVPFILRQVTDCLTVQFGKKILKLWIGKIFGLLSRQRGKMPCFCEKPGRLLIGILWGTQIFFAPCSCKHFIFIKKNLLVSNCWN